MSSFNANGRLKTGLMAVGAVIFVVLAVVFVGNYLRDLDYFKPVPAPHSTAAPGV